MNPPDVGTYGLGYCDITGREYRLHDGEVQLLGDHTWERSVSWIKRLEPQNWAVASWINSRLDKLAAYTPPDMPKEIKNMRATMTAVSQCQDIDQVREFIP